MEGTTQLLLRKGINLTIDVDPRNVLTDMFTHYSRSSDLLFYKVMFRFAEDEEENKCFEKTQKEILTRFWCEVFSTGFHGEKVKVPIKSNNDVRGPEALHWQAIGKILSHFMLLNKI